MILAGGVQLTMPDLAAAGSFTGFIARIQRNDFRG